MMDIDEYQEFMSKHYPGIFKLSKVLYRFSNLRIIIEGATSVCQDAMGYVAWSSDSSQRLL